MADVNYFVVKCKLDGWEKYLIWFSNGNDGLIVKNERILVFTDSLMAKEYCTLNKITLYSEDIDEIDLISSQLWARDPINSSMDVKNLLDAWNFLGDICSSIGFDLEENRSDFSDAVYNMLFLSNDNLANLIGQDPNSEDWSFDEIYYVANIIKRGLSIFQSHMQLYDES